MKDLTARQREVLDFVAKHIDTRGFPPTIREIGAALGIESTNGVDDHLCALVVKGFIRREERVSRGIFLERAKYDELVAASAKGVA